jgi:hypothetical protein
MGLADLARNKLWDPESPASLSTKLRGARWARFLETFPSLAEMSVLDLGGYHKAWERAPIHPRLLTTVNLDTQEVGVELPSWVRTLTGDATGDLDVVAGESYDLVYSNSVIEHVGGPPARARFAANARRLAPAYWIQAPAPSFPVEPHWVFPFFHHLPVGLRATVARHWPMQSQPSPKHPREQAVFDVLSVQLPSKTEMEALFPDAKIVHERFLGLTKSLVAVRTHA